MNSNDDENLYDIGRLLVTDPSEINKEEFEKNKDDYLIKKSKESVQKLINQIFLLPKQSTNEGVYTFLPGPTTDLPREKRVPEPKKETPWQKFAQQKGLQFKKKDFWVYDEVTDEFRPRVGPGSQKNKFDWIKDDKPSLDLSQPFQSKPSKKRKRDATGKIIVNNTPQQQQQQQQPSNQPPRKKRKLNDETVLHIPTTKSHRLHPSAKPVLKDSYDIARISTASMGKFDRKLKHERTVYDSSRNKNRKTGVFTSAPPLEQNNNKKTSNTMKDSSSHFESIANRVLKNVERQKRKIKENSRFQMTFEKQASLKEKKKTLVEQAKLLKFKQSGKRTKKRGTKKKQNKKKINANSRKVL